MARWVERVADVLIIVPILLETSFRVSERMEVYGKVRVKHCSLAGWMFPGAAVRIQQNLSLWALWRSDEQKALLLSRQESSREGDAGRPRVEAKSLFSSALTPC